MQTGTDAGTGGRCLVTHSLLNSWLYIWKAQDEYADKAWVDFLNTLNKVRTPTTEAQQKGINFEDLVVAIAEGGGDPSHKWYEAAAEVAQEIQGGQFQFRAKKEITVDGLPILLYGRLDCLKAGRIIDVKFTSKYEVGKFYDSPQHPTYFELVPEAPEFRYLVSNGTRVWREDYRRGEHIPVEELIGDFLTFLKSRDLFDTFTKYWSAKR